MALISCGILLYKKAGDEVEVLLVHPGGPFWAKKDLGAWSLPKGESEQGEDYLNAAKREFQEELGFAAPAGEYQELGETKLNSGKVIHVWAIKGDLDASKITSNKIQIDWPPKSGKKIEIPEVDRAEWVNINNAIPKMHKGQGVFVERLAGKLDIILEGSKDTTTTGVLKTQQTLF